MKVKKLIAIFILSAVLTAIFASCGNYQEKDKLYVIGTVFPQYDFARQIGGEHIDCEMLLQPGADSHSYTGDDPSDIYRIMKCDLFIYVGGETDSEWVERIKDSIESSGQKSPVFLSLCDVCDTIEEDSTGIIDEENESDESEAEPESDEHVWTSPKNAVLACLAIKDAMIGLDPKNAESYEENCTNYVDELLQLDEDYYTMIKNADSKTLVFADRFPFRYLAEEFGLSCYAAFSGCSSQSEPAPTTILKLCDLVEFKNIPCVFYIETSNSKVPEIISNATGCETALLHSCHTISQKELDSGETYLSIMKNNLSSLRKALYYDE